MITENVSTLKINKLTQEQYDRELAAGNIKDNEIYLTPVEEEVGDVFFVPWGVSGREISSTVPEYVYNEVEQAWQDRKSIFFKWHKLRYPGSSLASVQLVMPLTTKDSNNTFWFECIWESSVLRVGFFADGRLESSSYEIVNDKIEDVSALFNIAPDEDSSSYTTVNSARVYKHGKVICGEIEVELSGGGEYDTYWFSIQSPYVPTCMPTSSIVPLGQGAKYYSLSSVAFCHFGERLMIQVYNYGVHYATVAFTYICQ